MKIHTFGKKRGEDHSFLHGKTGLNDFLQADHCCLGHLYPIYLTLLVYLCQSGGSNKILHDAP